MYEVVSVFGFLFTWFCIVACMCVSTACRFIPVVNSLLIKFELHKCLFQVLSSDGPAASPLLLSGSAKLSAHGFEVLDRCAPGNGYMLAGQVTFSHLGCIQS